MSGQTPEFINKKYTRKKALFPLYEDKNTREHLAGVATQVNKGPDSPHFSKQKKLFPQSYGMALGTHGISYQYRVKQEETQHDENSYEELNEPQTLLIDQKFVPKINYHEKQ
jgi:hypothetical protein